MATKKNEERVYFDITGMKVSNVRELGKGIIAFSLLGKGLGLYNLRIVNGKNGEFVAVPQEKGKDGNYYNVYNVYLADEDQQKVIKAVKTKLPEDGAEL